MRIVGIKVGSRSALTAKRDGTVLWTPPIDVDPHDFSWQPVVPGQTPQAVNRVQLDPALSSELRSSTDETQPALSTYTGTAYRGTVVAGPVWDNVNRNWWYQVDWDDELLGSSNSWTYATNLQQAVENRAPVAAAQSLTATVGTAISITLAATDADGDELTYTVQQGPGAGVLRDEFGSFVIGGSQLNSTNLTYTPSAEGTDGFSFIASDGVLNSETAWVGIINSPVDAEITLLGLEQGNGTRSRGNSLDSIVFTAESSYTASTLHARLTILPANTRLRMAIYSGSGESAELLGFTAAMTPTVEVNTLALNADVAIVAGQTYMLSAWMSYGPPGGPPYPTHSAINDEGTRLRRDLVLNETGAFPNPYGPVDATADTTYALWAGAEIIEPPPPPSPVTLLGLEQGNGFRAQGNSLDSIVFTAESSYAAKELRARFTIVSPQGTRLRMAIYSGSGPDAELLGFTAAMTPIAGVNSLPLNADVAIVAGQTYMLSAWVSFTQGTTAPTYSANDGLGTRLRRNLFLNETGPFPDPYGTISETTATTYALWAGAEITVEPPVEPPPEPPPIEGTVSRSSINQHGITWTFNQPYQCGQYCNGDWFVIGPVVNDVIGPVIITAISPIPTTGRNGTVVNPVGGRYQGFDDRIYGNFYDASRNVGTSMPLSVAVNSSVVSSISKPARTNYTSIETFAVLTVVSAAPTAGSFRPCYRGSGSRASLFNANQIDYNRLQKLSPPASTPDINVAAAQFERTWYEQDLTWTGWYFHTEYMSVNGYGRDLAVRTGSAGLLLHLNYSEEQKKNLLIRYIQYGIDIYGILVNGGRWGADGGHNNGRLSPLLTAAAVLNDSRILAQVPRGAPNFQEYEQTFRVEQSDVGTKGFWQDLDKDGVKEFFGGINGTSVVQYTDDDIGMDEWGAAHVTNPEKDNNKWNALYRDTAGGTLTCVTMVARALGLRTLCAWEPLFLYAIRHINYEQGNGPIPYGGEFSANPTPTFHKAFYNASHTQYP